MSSTSIVHRPQCSHQRKCVALGSQASIQGQAKIERSEGSVFCSRRDARERKVTQLVRSSIEAASRTPSPYTLRDTHQRVLAKKKDIERRKDVELKIEKLIDETRLEIQSFFSALYGEDRIESESEIASNIEELIDLLKRGLLAKPTESRMEVEALVNEMLVESLEGGLSVDPMVSQVSLLLNSIDPFILKTVIDGNILFENRGVSVKIPILHYAIKIGNVDIVRLLLNSGCDVNNVPEDGCSALRTALFSVENDDFSIPNLLIERGALHHCPDKELVSNIEKNLVIPLDPIIFMAIDFSKVNIVNFLLESGVDANIKNRDGKSLLRCIYEKCAMPRDRHEMVSLLLEKKLDKEDRVYLLNKIIEEDGSDTLNVMFNTKQIDIHNIDATGKTLMMKAVENKAINIITFLLERNANLKGVDVDFLFKLVISSDSVRALELLLQRDCYDVNMKDGEGSSLLQYAVKRKSLNIISFLLDRGADIFHVNARGHTVLETAVIVNDIKLFIALLKDYPDKPRTIEKAFLFAKASRRDNLLRALGKAYQYLRNENK